MNRRTLLWLHRWVGVLAGLVILIVAVTGGALVFQQDWNRWLHPELYPKSGAHGPMQPIAQALDVLHQSHPEARVDGVRPPRDDRDALLLFAGARVMHVEPHTGELLGWRPRRTGPTATLTKLHVNLLAGPTGGWIVVGATCVSIGLALTGLWLWWPLRIAWFRRGGDSRRFHLDLHSVAGLYSSAFLLIIAITGLTLRFFHVEHPRVPPSQPPAIQRERIAVDEAIRQAEAALPGARAAGIEMPAPNPRACYRVQVAFPEDGSPAGRSVVFIDQFSGSVLSIHNARHGTWLERYGNLQLSLHIGAIGGRATQWLAFLVCVALVLQIFSGYVLWWKRARD